MSNMKPNSKESGREENIRKYYRECWRL